VTLLLFAVAAGLGAAVTHWWHRTRTLAADHWHYDRVRAEVTPVRQIVEENDRLRRLCARLEHDNARLRAVATAWQARVARLLARLRVVGPTPNPNPFPRIRLFRWLP
jgi:hypothetical protein